MLFTLSLTLLIGAPAGAQSAGPYVATSPTKGALYADGQDDRYLLGGEWLYRADPTNIGVTNGWWRNNSSTGRLVSGQRAQLLQRR